MLIVKIDISVKLVLVFAPLSSESSKLISLTNVPTTKAILSHVSDRLIISYASEVLAMFPVVIFCNMVR